jgi:hypothetical protein
MLSLTGSSLVSAIFFGWHYFRTTPAPPAEAQTTKVDTAAYPQLPPNQQISRVGKTNKERPSTAAEAAPNNRKMTDLGPYLYKFSPARGWPAEKVDPRKYANPSAEPGPLPIDPPSINAMREVYEIPLTFNTSKILTCSDGIMLPGETSPTKFCKESIVPRINGLYRPDIR